MTKSDVILWENGGRRMRGEGGLCEQTTIKTLDRSGRAERYDDRSEYRSSDAMEERGEEEGGEGGLCEQTTNKTLDPSGRADRYDDPSEYRCSDHSGDRSEYRCPDSSGERPCVSKLTSTRRLLSPVTTPRTYLQHPRTQKDARGTLILEYINNRARGMVDIARIPFHVITQNQGGC